jgi:hypothetical protein
VEKIPCLLILLLLLESVACADVAPFGYTRMDPVAALSWLVYMMAVAGVVIYSKGNKTDDKGLSGLPAALVILGALWAMFSFLAVDFLYGILFGILGLIGLSLGKSILAISKSRGKEINKNLILAGLLIVAILLAQSNLFAFPPRRSGSIVALGWNKIQPLYQTVFYSAGNRAFSAAFQNVLGASIRLNAITAYEGTTNTTCSVVTSGGSTAADKKINAGDIFNISSDCAAAGKTQGDAYDMEITINYTAIVGNLTTEHIERGRIKGPVES